LASCKNCAKVFGKRDIRVKTKLELGGTVPKLGEVSFCVSKECITNGLKKYNLKVRNLRDMSKCRFVLEILFIAAPIDLATVKTPLTRR
jgi:hypothetical protein